MDLPHVAQAPWGGPKGPKGRQYAIPFGGSPHHGIRFADFFSFFIFRLFRGHSGVFWFAGGHIPFLAYYYTKGAKCSLGSRENLSFKSVGAVWHI